MATLLPLAVSQFLDANGVPLAGGSWADATGFAVKNGKVEPALADPSLSKGYAGDAAARVST